MSSIKQGPGFPNTRKGRGFTMTLLVSGIVALLGAYLGLDSVEFWWLFELLKDLDVSVTFS
jgi:hypothetical protein